MDCKEENFSFNVKEKLLTKCYFCHEIFPEEQLQNHLLHCQLTLEKCPQNCGVYITRQQRYYHVQKQCSHSKVIKHTSPQVVEKNNCVCCESCKDINEIESEIKIIQLRIDDEKRNRLQFEYTWLNELSKLHERYKKNDEWRESMFSVLSTLQKSIHREEQIRLKEINEINYKFDRISSVLQNFELCINELDDITKETKNECVSRSGELEDKFDEWRIRQENRLASLRNLNQEFEKLREDHISRSRSLLDLVDINEIIAENQEQCSEQVKNYSKDIETFKEFLNKENNLICTVRNEQLQQFKCFKEDFEKTESMLQELLTWQKHVKKKLIKIERMINAEFTEPISIDSGHSVTVPQNDIPIYSNGHLLWCIINFEEQLEESKLSNVVLQSPPFYSSEYGYKLQMRLHPNGLGQWKGRHMIISLHVIDTEWDSLLTWPFKMNATVLIRDQSALNEQEKNIVKCFGNNIVNKDNELTRVLQMFIPHRLLKENSYVNNNSVILEAQVKIIYD